MTTRDMPLAPETVLVTDKRVACDGGGALGHPLVYLDMGQSDFVECGYCDRRFVLVAEQDASDYHSPAPRHDDGH